MTTEETSVSNSARVSPDTAPNLGNSDQLRTLFPVRAAFPLETSDVTSPDLQMFAQILTMLDVRGR